MTIYDFRCESSLGTLRAKVATTTLEQAKARLPKFIDWTLYKVSD